MRYGRLAAAMALGWLTIGCEAQRSRTYAVTLLDSASIDCYGYPRGLLADPEELTETAERLEGEWKDAYAKSPPVAQPRILRVNELETRVQAWFDPSSSGEFGLPAVDAGGDGGPGGGSAHGGVEPPEQELGDVPYRFDDPGVVYEGVLHDGYVEGSYAELVDTDEADEAQGLYPCGARARAHGVLTITESGGAEGRVRWAHVIYVASDYSACEGRIECARDIHIEGLALD